MTISNSDITLHGQITFRTLNLSILTSHVAHDANLSFSTLDDPLLGSLEQRGPKIASSRVFRNLRALTNTRP